MFRVILVVTFGGLPETIIDGIVQHVEVTPSAMAGSSTITVTGQDLSAVMDLIDLSGLPYPGMRPDLRVLTILGKYAVFGVIPAVVPAIAPDIPVPVDKIPTQKGTDFAYIQQLAKEAGYVFYVEPGPVPGTSQAYWGPLVKIGVPQPALNVNMDAWTNVESLNFRYEPQSAVLPIVFIQDQTTKVVIPAADPVGQPAQPAARRRSCRPRRRSRSSRTRPSCRRRRRCMIGLARATETGDVVTGDGTLDVLRYGRTLQGALARGGARRGARLRRAALRREHHAQIKRGEYKQSFTLKRNALISNLPVVPTIGF